MDWLFGNSDEVEEAIKYYHEESSVFGTKVKVADLEILGILTLLAIEFPLNEAFLKQKIVDFNYVYESGALNKKDFHNMLDKDHPPMKKAFQKARERKDDNILALKKYDFVKGNSWGDYVTHGSKMRG